MRRVGIGDGVLFCVYDVFEENGEGAYEVEK
jgi:hypothetical protein